MENLPNQEQVIAAVKWLISFGGGYAVAKGWVTSDQLVLITGAAVAIVPLVWSFYDKTVAARVKQVAKIEGVQVLVGPKAQPDLKILAADPTHPDIISK